MQLNTVLMDTAFKEHASRREPLICSAQPGVQVCCSSVDSKWRPSHGVFRVRPGADSTRVTGLAIQLARSKEFCV